MTCGHFPEMPVDLLFPFSRFLLVSDFFSFSGGTETELPARCTAFCCIDRVPCGARPVFQFPPSHSRTS
jgi:hypothetical protein